LRYARYELRGLLLCDLGAKPGSTPAPNVDSMGQVVISGCSRTDEGARWAIGPLPCFGAAFGLCEEIGASALRLDISVSLDRFLRWYAPLNDLLRFHQQKNNTSTGTRTAPTATGAAIAATLFEDLFEEPPSAIGGLVTAAGEGEPTNRSELVVATDFPDEEFDEDKPDAEPVVVNEDLEIVSVREGEEAWGVDEDGAEGAAEGDAGGVFVGGEVDIEVGGATGVVGLAGTPAVCTGDEAEVFTREVAAGAAGGPCVGEV
jgi:hypothetical protein